MSIVTETARNAPPKPATNALLSAPIVPTLLRLTLPNLLGMLATALVAIAETAYVGQLGTSSLAGLALVFPIVMLQQMMSSGAMGGGVSSAIARAIGAGQDARAASLAVHAMIIGLIGGLAFSVLMLLGGGRIFALLGGRGAALEAALTYANVVFFGSVGVWLTNTLASICRGTGNMKVPSATLLATASLQVLLGGALGFGFGPLPRLGIAGIALANVIAFGFGTAFLLWFLTSNRARVRLSFANYTPDREIFRDILRVGVLACVSPLQTVLSILILARLVSEFGPEALAGYGIGARFEFMLVPFSFAVGVACVPMVGMAIGAGEVARARRVAWAGGIISAVVSGLVGIIVTFQPDLWARLFTTEPAVLAATRTYFMCVGPAYGFFGLGLCLYFASQGAGRVLGPVLAGTARLIAIGAVGWWLAVTGAPTWHLFALVGVAMTGYGILTALAIWLVPWEPATPQLPEGSA